MGRLTKAAWTARIWTDKHGQDLVEYSLMAGFVALAASATMPTLANQISTIFSKVSSLATRSANQGS